MKGWALAYLHLTPDQFEDLFLPEFWAALRAHQEEKDADRRHIGELVRGATIRLFNLQVKCGSQYTDVRKFWAMPWDEAPVDEEEEIRRLTHLSDEERTNEARKFLERMGHAESEP